MGQICHPEPIKLIGVRGKRLEGSEGDITRDFVLMTGAALGTITAEQLPSQRKLLARQILGETFFSQAPILHGPYVAKISVAPVAAVARLRTASQTRWRVGRSKAIEDEMAAHRPIGSIMRVRKMACAMSAHFRADHNHEPIVEPHNPGSIPA